MAQNEVAPQQWAQWLAKAQRDHYGKGPLVSKVYPFAEGVIFYQRGVLTGAQRAVAQTDLGQSFLRLNRNQFACDVSSRLTELMGPGHAGPFPTVMSDVDVRADAEILLLLRPLEELSAEPDCSAFAAFATGCLEEFYGRALERAAAFRRGPFLVYHAGSLLTPMQQQVIGTDTGRLYLKMGRTSFCLSYRHTFRAWYREHGGAVPAASFFDIDATGKATLVAVFDENNFSLRSK